jgi:hypothetical protein
LAAVPEDELVRTNTDVHAATRTVLGALRALRASRSSLRAGDVPDRDSAPDDLGELTPEGNRLRKRMIADVPPAPTAPTLQPVENGDRFRR